MGIIINVFHLPPNSVYFAFGNLGLFKRKRRYIYIQVGFVHFARVLNTEIVFDYILECEIRLI